MSTIKYLSEDATLFLVQRLIAKINSSSGSFSGNYNDLTNKPTKLSEFTNDSNFQTDSQVLTAITNAMSDITGFSAVIVETLPTTGETNKIYLVVKEGTADDGYNEYMWIDSKWEFIGSTSVDMTDYIKRTDMVALTNQEILDIIALAEV
ncbi:hypothetical protein [Globicatella sulfidifaciens]|uniref:Uncharacterized protein n=1 Tax=Globicatella sulfidifaciens TaxID=136093 RepID=A0A7X8C3P5_9LACT|nr:hypothetical protein [Globicatella sulfidifaciens]NLJ18370.1 hypothetical protein [Globicatella sulfidifaciens]